MFILEDTRIMRKERALFQEKEKKNIWSVVLKVIIAVATALGGALGLTSCL